MKTIGLTGGIACGKTTIAGMLRSLGVPVLDADAIVRELQAPGGRAHARLREEFGPAYFLENGELDRKKLGALVFADEKRRERLDALIHPMVREELLARLEALRAEGRPIAVLDVPLLFESGMEDLADEIWIAYADAPEQLGRLMRRDGLTVPEALQRVRSQMPLSLKILRGDVVLDTVCPIKALEQRVREALRRAQASGA